MPSPISAHMWQKYPAIFPPGLCASAILSGLRLTLFICCSDVLDFFFRRNFSSCDSWPGRARRAVHLNTLAKFGASVVSAIGEIMAYYGAPKVTCSSRHWSDRMTWPPTQTHAASTLEHSPQLEVLTYMICIDTISILGSTLVRRITCYFHLGHCYVPARPVMMRAIDDSYKRWLTAANPCRRGSCYTMTFGLARLAAAPQTFLEMKTTRNTEVCGLTATADRAGPDCTTLDTCTHLPHNDFFFFSRTLMCHHRLLFSVPHVLCIYRHDFPNRVSHSLHFPVTISFKKMHCAATRPASFRRLLFYVVRLSFPF